MDEIRIEGLQVFANHGVYQEEKEKGQDFYVNAILYTDTRQAGLKDDLTLSTNYGEVCHFITKYMQDNTWDLIETVAEKTAEAVLLQFPLINELDLEIRKPHAPIGLPFDCVSVRIHRGWKKAYLAVGSNLGDRRGYIKAALEAMDKKQEIRKLRASTLIESTPYGDTAEYDFINGAVELETLLTPEELLIYLHELEQAADRKREIHWGPRTLDLDILFYEGVRMDTKELTIPHPDLQNRDFVLEPLAELSPYLYHEGLHQNVTELLKKLKERHIK